MSGQQDEPAPPLDSDEGLALRFAERHDGEFRYVPDLGRWFVWTGQVWERDGTLAGIRAARAICREASAKSNGRERKQLASAQTVAAVERLAKADERIVATTDLWDADPWALNTPSGVVDLSTGQLREHRPDDFMTKITAVAPGGKCPLWLGFLDRVMDGDRELITYLQRLAGYALTGLTREQMFGFAHGTGGNGKGVFFNTLAGIMADYHTVLPIEAITMSRNERHPTELAMLHGAPRDRAGNRSGPSPRAVTHQLWIGVQKGPR